MIFVDFPSCAGMGTAAIVYHGLLMLSSVMRSSSFSLVVARARMSQLEGTSEPLSYVQPASSAHKNKHT